jgi:cytochrome c oxidase assembly protein subunit 15
MLGGAAVLNELSPAVVAAHLALGEALLGCMVLVLVVGYRGPLSVPSAGRVHGGDIGPFPFLMLASTVSVYVLLLSGTYVTATGAIAACMDWPLCQGSIIPHGKLALVHVAHRLAAAGVGILLMGTLHLGFRGRQRPPYIRHLSMAVASLFIFQVAVGAATIWLGFPDPLIALHVAIATAVWSLMVALLALSFARQSVLSGEASRA